MLTLLDRGGGILKLTGFIELGYGAVPLRSLAERAVMDPKPIDEATLNALDEKS